MLNTRQKCLLYFVNKTEECSKLKLAKVSFLIKEEGDIERRFKFYSFIPYRYGPYSFEMFHDIETLEKENVLKTDENMINYTGEDVKLPIKPRQILDRIYNETRLMDEGELMSYVYNKYPDYTIFSELDRRKDYLRNRTGVITSGYEGRSIDEFLMKLIREKIHVLVDVRKNPWSMKFGFKKHEVQSFCAKLGIDYLNYSSLGIPGKFRRELKTRSDYEELFSKYITLLSEKEEELNSLKRMSENYRIALMCFEKDPEYCHRHIIAEELGRRGSEVEIN